MAEAYSGQVRGGVVVFEGRTPPLTEGTEVRVLPVRARIETVENDESGGVYSVTTPLRSPVGSPSTTHSLRCE